MLYFVGCAYFGLAQLREDPRLFDYLPPDTGGSGNNGQFIGLVNTVSKKLG